MTINNTFIILKTVTHIFLFYLFSLIALNGSIGFLNFFIFIFLSIVYISSTLREMDKIHNIIKKDFFLKKRNKNKTTKNDYLEQKTEQIKKEIHKEYINKINILKYSSLCLAVLLGVLNFSESSFAIFVLTLIINIFQQFKNNNIDYKEKIFMLLNNISIILFFIFTYLNQSIQIGILFIAAIFIFLYVKLSTPRKFSNYSNENIKD